MGNTAVGPLCSPCSGEYDPSEDIYPCLHCDGISQNCTRCGLDDSNNQLYLDTSFLNPEKSDHQSCTLECPNTYWEDDNTLDASGVGPKCSPCSTNCLWCDSNATDCTKCDSSSNMFLDTHEDKNQCVLHADEGGTGCPDTFWHSAVDLNNPVCAPCDSDCLLC